MELVSLYGRSVVMIWRCQSLMRIAATHLMILSQLQKTTERNCDD